MYDAIVIGGGFYGLSVGAYLAGARRFRRVLLVERERELMGRASMRNQARIHAGYHYPRSLTTARRSRVNAPRFLREHARAVVSNGVSLYAVARRDSRVTASQFERFCATVGAHLSPAPPALESLFEGRLVERVYLAEESVFDASLLRREAEEELARLGVEVRLGTRAGAVRRTPAGLEVELHPASGPGDGVRESARTVFDCAYSGLNRIGGDFAGASTRIKHELAELALLRVPAVLRGCGVTLMDGPFFSLLPHPPSGGHALSHVRYTPHTAWEDAPGVDPYQRLDCRPGPSRAGRMLRDATRYLPVLGRAVVTGSVYEVKTVLLKNESDDGRPVLFESVATLPGMYLVLGGKIDNVYDVLERIDGQPL